MAKNPDGRQSPTSALAPQFEESATPAGRTMKIAYPTPGSGCTIPANQALCPFDMTASPSQGNLSVDVHDRLSSVEASLKAVHELLAQQRIEADAKLSQVCRNTQGLGDAKFKKAVLHQLQAELQPLTNALHTTIVTHKAEREFISQQLHEVLAAVERNSAQSKELLDNVASLVAQTNWVGETGQSFKNVVGQMQTFFSRDCQAITSELDRYDDIRESIEEGLQRALNAFEMQQRSLATTADQLHSVDRLEREMQKLNSHLDRLVLSSTMAAQPSSSSSPMTRPTIILDTMPPAVPTWMPSPSTIPMRDLHDFSSSSQCAAAAPVTLGPSSNNKELFRPNENSDLLLTIFPRQVQWCPGTELLGDNPQTEAHRPPSYLCLEDFAASSSTEQEVAAVLQQWSTHLLEEGVLDEADISLQHSDSD